MTTSVKGYHAPDEEWTIKKAAYDACEAANIPIPEELDKYFDYEPPIAGKEISIQKALTPISDDMSEGYELDLTKLPPEVKTIRFTNTW